MVTGYVMIPTHAFIRELTLVMDRVLMTWIHQLPRDHQRPQLQEVREDIRIFIRDFMAQYMFYWADQLFLVKFDQRSNMAHGIQAGVSPPIFASALALMSIPLSPWVKVAFEFSQSQGFPLADEFHKTTRVLDKHLAEYLDLDTYDGLVGNKVEFVRWQGDDMVLRVFSDEDRLMPY